MLRNLLKKKIFRYICDAKKWYANCCFFFSFFLFALKKLNKTVVGVRWLTHYSHKSPIAITMSSVLVTMSDLQREKRVSSPLPFSFPTHPPPLSTSLFLLKKILLHCIAEFIQLNIRYFSPIYFIYLIIILFISFFKYLFSNISEKTNTYNIVLQSVLKLIKFADFFIFYHSISIFQIICTFYNFVKTIKIKIFFYSCIFSILVYI